MSAADATATTFSGLLTEFFDDLTIWDSAGAQDPNQQTSLGILYELLC